MHLCLLAQLLYACMCALKLGPPPCPSITLLNNTALTQARPP